MLLGVCLASEMLRWCWQGLEALGFCWQGMAGSEAENRSDNL
jgi:hypothetical protein